VTALAEPLEQLLDLRDSAAVAIPLPAEIEEAYGGPFALDERSVFSNFVSSLDGVVSMPSLTQSSALIGDGNDADRFVMALLRACADAVLVGSGTLRGSPASLWTAERVYPDAADSWTELRAALGLAPTPALALLTASGEVDVEHPALADGALVLTTARGASTLEARLPSAAEIVELDGVDEVDVSAAVDLLRARGHGRILSEAGPTIHGSLLAAGVLDEVFLTVSPLFAGRGAGERRLGLVEGRELLPDTRVPGLLTGVRRHGEHLFLRYRID
jgi:riboflavin biosynthesis pyrimidine reductase